MSCVIIPAAVWRRKFLRGKKKSTTGNFPSMINSSTSTAGANMESGLGKISILSEEFKEILTDLIQLPVTKAVWLHCLNMKWKWSETHANTTNVWQMHVCRHYLCLASKSLSAPLRLWEGDLHWKCDGNQAVATVSVTVSDNTYCKAPVYNHAQIARPVWSTQPVICHCIVSDSWQGIKIKWWRGKSDFCDRCQFSLLFLVWRYLQMITGQVNTPSASPEPEGSFHLEGYQQDVNTCG